MKFVRLTSMDLILTNIMSTMQINFDLATDVQKVILCLPLETSSLPHW